MNIEAQHAEAVPAPDLEIRVTTPWGTRSGQQLQYTLNSPSGAVPYTHHPIPGPRIHDPEAFCKRLFSEIEGFRSGVDPTGSKALSVRQDITAIGKNLFQELLPQELQLLYPTLREQAKTLVIVSDEAWIPWEMLHPPAKLGKHFLCLEWDLSRWLTGPASYSARLNLQQAIAVATAKEFDLPQGEDEVKEIQRKLQAASGVEVSAVLNPSWQEFRDLVHREDLDLLHVSGHGRFHESLKESVLQVGGASFRTLHLAEEANSSRGSRRAFVFFNVCQLGRVAESITQVEGWPPRWIRQRGCGGFIGPMWSVKDDSAEKFADTFYREALGGATLAAALRSTRWALREQSVSPLTWLAYSFYGHPNARLGRGQGPLPSTDSGSRPSSTTVEIPSVLDPGSSDSSQRTVGTHKPVTSPLLSPVASSPPRQQALVQRPSTAPQRQTNLRKTWIGWGFVLACLGLVGAGMVGMLPPWTASDTSVQETPAPNPSQEGKDEERPHSAPSTPPAKVEPQEFNEERTADSDDGLTPRSDTLPPELEPEVQRERAQEMHTAPQRPFPVSAPQPGRLAILVVDRERQALDREVASAVQNLLFEEVPAVSATVPKATAQTIGAFLDDPGGLLLGDGTPWGAQYLLLVSADTNPLSDSPGLTSLSLSLRAHLVEAQSGSTLARNASTHTGRGASTDQALSQALKRCLRKVLNILNKESEE